MHVYNMLTILWDECIRSLLLKSELSASRGTNENILGQQSIIYSSDGLQRLYNNELIARRFKQHQPKCIYALDCSIREVQSNIYSNGTLFITNKYIYYASFNNAKRIEVTIPFFDIDRLGEITEETPFIDIISGTKHFHVIGSRTKMIYAYKKLTRLIRQFGKRAYGIQCHGPNNVTKNFFLLGKGHVFVANDKFFEYVASGVEDSSRSIVWQYASGSYYSKVFHEADSYYSRTLERFRSGEWKDKSLIESIDEDIARSCASTDTSRDNMLCQRPSEDESVPIGPHSSVEIENSVSTSQVSESSVAASLRNILITFAIQNPHIGYCQSMNIVGAFLLSYMDEISSFYILNTICQNMLANFYSKTISGTLINQKIFSSLLELKLPNLRAYLKMKKVPYKLIVAPWFMCIFISYLPQQVVVRILDRFFTEGIVTLHKAALALFSLRQERILHEAHGFQITSILKEEVVDETLFFSEMDKYNDIDMENYHSHYQRCALLYIKQLEKNNATTPIEQEEDN